MRIPTDVLGDVNAGWGVAMTTLANERTFMGGGGGRSLQYRDLVELARSHGVATTPWCVRASRRRTRAPRSRATSDARAHAHEPRAAARP